MTNHSQLFPDKKEKVDFGIAITVILLFFVAIIYYLYVANDSNQNFISDNSEQVLEEPNSSFAYTKTKQAAIVEKTRDGVREGQVDDLPIGDERNTSTLKSNTKIEAITFENDKDTLIKNDQKELPVYIEEEESEMEEEADYKEDIDIEVQEKEPSITKEAERIGEDSTLAEFKSSDKNIELKSTESDKGYDCIIIIGSFEEPSNAKALISQLKKESYPVYEGAYRGYYVVGVNSDCAATKINPLLKKLRKEYDKKAWIYKR